MSYTSETKRILEAIASGDCCPDCNTPNGDRHFDECPQRPDNTASPLVLGASEIGFVWLDAAGNEHEWDGKSLWRIGSGAIEYRGWCTRCTDPANTCGPFKKVRPSAVAISADLATEVEHLRSEVALIVRAYGEYESALADRMHGAVAAEFVLQAAASIARRAS